MVNILIVLHHSLWKVGVVFFLNKELQRIYLKFEHKNTNIVCLLLYLLWNILLKL